MSMNFGGALEALKQGERVQRAGWNGQGMWLEHVLNIHSIEKCGTGKTVYRLTHSEQYQGMPWIGMKTADDQFVPWLASQTDMLADDWQVVV